MELGNSSLSNLTKIRKNVKRKRISSYNIRGTNHDNVIINSKTKFELCNIHSSGIIKHIWVTIGTKDPDPYYLRKTLIRMWWDSERNPSVECPIGNYFGMGHA